MQTGPPSKHEVVRQCEEIQSGIQGLQDTLIELAYVGNRRSVDPEALAAALAFVKEFKSTLNVAEGEVARALSTVVSNNEVVDAGIARFERRDSKPKRKWRHQQLKSVLVETVLARHTDKETGVLDAPVAVIVEEVLSHAGINYWKSTTLKEIGINADDFCERGEAKPGFQLIKPTTNEDKDEEDDFLDS